MAPTQRNSTWNPGRGGSEIDAVDLTLSSPEPEVRPRVVSRTALRQQQLPTHLKPQSLQSSSSTARMKDKGKVTTNLTGKYTQQMRRVHPQHLEQIMESTDPSALRAVVLQLCAVSPALAGALARGLAPHSSFAFNLMHQRSTKTSTTGTIKHEQNDDEDANSRLKQRLVPKLFSRDSRSPSNFSTTQSVGGPAPQSKSQMKREREVEDSDSIWDSDLELTVPGAYPLSARQASSFQPPNSRTASRSPMPTTVPRLLFSAGSEIKTEPKLESKVCVQCHETVEDEDGMCWYHPGPERNVDGVSTCGACSGSMSYTGCSFGMHEFESAVDVAHKRTKPERSQSPSKRLRIG